MEENVVPPEIQEALRRMTDIMHNMEWELYEYNNIAEKNGLPEIVISINNKPDTSMHVMD